MNTTHHPPSDFGLGRSSRRHRRAGLAGFVGDLCDGKAVYGCHLLDVSLGGFRVTDLPETFVACRHNYVAVLSGGGAHYRIVAKPCWKRPGKVSGCIDIGFKILDAPWRWIEFVMNEIQGGGDDPGFPRSS